MRINPVRTILLKESRTHFDSSTAYIVTPLFLLLTGWFFISPFFLADRADMRDFFSLMPLLLAVIIPALTMRLYAGEISSGHHEILGTLPISPEQIMWGKYLASMVFLLGILLPTLIYPVFISTVGDLDWGPVWGGYVGTILLGGSYCAIGLLSSSLTKNQAGAFLISSAICLFLALIDDMAVFLPGGVREGLRAIGTDFHFQGFTKGLLDLRELVYFLSITGFSLLLLREVLNEKH